MLQVVKTGLMKTRYSCCFTSETASIMSYVAGLHDALHLSVFIVAQIVSFEMVCAILRRQMVKWSNICPQVQLDIQYINILIDSS